MKLFLVICLICSPLFSVAKVKKTTPLQQSVQDCLPDQKNIPTLKKMSDVQNFVEEKFALVRHDLVSREVVYREANDEKKLKFLNGKITLYKVNADDEGAVEPIPNDVRQRGITIESYINQLLIRATIMSDWSMREEIRIGGVEATISQRDKIVYKYKVKFIAPDRTLDCSIVKNKDLCTCVK